MRIRIGLIAAAAACIISFALGLFAGTPAALLILRALIFAALFFGLATGITYLIDTRLDVRDEESMPGQNLDMSIEGALFSGKKNTFGAEFSIPDTAFEPGNPAQKESGAINISEDASIIEDIAGLYAPDGEVFSSPALDTNAGTGAEEGGLAQNADYNYHTFGSIASPENARDSASQAKAAADTFSDFGFIAGMPGLDGADNARTEAEGGRNVTLGTVEMSLQKTPSGPDFSNLDGKKAAGAIQTILKKEKE